MSESWRTLDGGDGVEVAVRVTPRAARAGLSGHAAGVDGNAWLLARVTVPPENGKANETPLALVAGALHVARSACELVAGAGSRRKRVRVRGDGPELARRQAGLAAGPA